MFKAFYCEECGQDVSLCSAGTASALNSYLALLIKWTHLSAVAGPQICPMQPLGVLLNYALRSVSIQRK